MRFTKLELANWRNFRAAEIPLQPRTFIVGPNASGKSNLLDALRFLKELAEDGGGLQRAASERRGGLKAIRSLHARTDNDVSIVVSAVDSDGGTWTYELVLTEAKKPRVPIVRREVIRRTGAAPEFEIVRNPKSEDQEERTQTWLEQRSRTKDFRALAQFFASIEYTHVVPQVVREQRRPADAAGRHDPYGSELIEEMAETPSRERERRLKIINRAMAAVLPQFKDLEVEHDGVGRPHLVAGYKHWRGVAAHQREGQFSDGTLRIIGLLWTVSGKGGPILLEEPEISLHERAVSKLPAILHRAASQFGRQVIVSTHSESLLNDTGIEPAEIVRLETTTEDTRIILGSDDSLVVALARAGKPFGTELVGMTAPSGVDQLALQVGG
jgi:predicted ATPase